ncbi:MAG: hypothetical protein WD851_10190 [Pirellulales bacterium]
MKHSALFAIVFLIGEATGATRLMAVTIQFEATLAPHNASNSLNFGTTPYVESNFKFLGIPNQEFRILARNNPVQIDDNDGDIGFWQWAVGTSPDRGIALMPPTGQLFSIQSVDLGQNFNSLPGAIRFRGIKADGELEITFQTAARQFNTYEFPYEWRDLQQVAFNQVGPGEFNAIDNIVLNEPGPPPPPLGDYNENGTVDAADYTVWRDQFGTLVEEGTGPDGNNNGFVDSFDRLIWQEYFGDTNLELASLPVPEPASIALAIAALLAIGVSWNRP